MVGSSAQQKQMSILAIKAFAKAAADAATKGFTKGLICVLLAGTSTASPSLGCGFSSGRCPQTLTSRSGLQADKNSRHCSTTILQIELVEHANLTS
jgi:hypothetical protein